MLLDDPVLPAAAELAGEGALAVLRAAVGAAGGHLHDGRCAQVHYQPGRELVARYRCDVIWPDGRRRNDTILAATAHEHLPGTVPLVADLDGRELAVSVWRWPFDPLVPGLETAVTPSALTPQLAGLVTGPIRVEVVAYRPTERAVVRVHGAAGEVLYLKALRPADVDPIAAQHDALLDAGLPVPRVLAADPTLGLLVLAELPGTTFRDRLKSGQRPWPAPAAIADLTDRIAGAAVFGNARRASRTRDAISHIELLEILLPDRGDDLRRVAAVCRAALGEVESRSGCLVHGDLHEAQLVVDDDGAITGLLDIDDCAPGDPLDDPGVLMAHLTYRAITATDAPLRRAIGSTVDELHAEFAQRHDPGALDRAVGAALMGLATGPFRIQMDDWQHITARVVDAAQAHIARAEGIAPVAPETPTGHPTR